MSVTDYLALYTTLLGWQQYNNLWQIATGTGLIYLPFISLILQSALNPFLSMGAKDAAQIAVRRLTIGVMSSLFVIVFAAVPSVPLDPKVLHFEPLCSKEEKIAIPSHTGTTYDNTFSVPTGVRVPILWYFVMAFSNGLTHAASIGLSCSPIDYRALHSQLDTSKIQDSNLKQEVAQFYNNCYIPAYSAYLSEKLNPTQEAQIQQSLEKNGKDDVGWLGSQTLLNVNGLYDTHNAQTPVKDFPFDAHRDMEESQVPNHLAAGRPDCKTWWSDPNHGLSAKLKQHLPPDFLSSLMRSGGDTQKLQNAAIKTLISHSFGKNQTLADQLRGYQSLNDNVNGDYFSRFIGGAVGTVYESLTYYPKLHLLMNALPIIQGSLLFALYAFLALAIPFSGYRIKFCITGSIVIFSVIFCSYLWHLVQWFDNYLIQALYPGLGGVAGLGGILSNLDNSNSLLVDMIIGTLYVVLPILWMTVMGWVGFEAGSFISGVFSNMNTVTNSAGEKVGNTARKYLP